MDPVSILIEVAGWSSAAVLLTAYALVSRRRLRSDGTAFQAMNVIGATGIAIHSGSNRAWASVVVNLIWIAVGIATLVSRPVSSDAGAA
jgi:hypothetical protein